MRAVLPTLVLVVLLAAPAAATHRFADVPDDGTFAREISWAADGEVVEGYADGTFRPAESVSRLEAMVMVHNYATGLDGRAGADPATLAGVRAWADANGLWGRGADRSIAARRAEVVTYLARYHTRLDGGTLRGSTPFGDVGATYETEIGWAATSGVVRGYGDGTFGPSDPVTRGQMTAVLRNYAVAFDGLEPLDGGETTYGRTAATPVMLGEQVELLDWTVTITDWEPDGDEQVAAASEFNEPPRNGNHGLITVQARYHGPDRGIAWLDLELGLRGADGRLYDDAGCQAVTAGELFDEPDVVSGGRVTGTECVDFPDAALGRSAVLYVRERLVLDEASAYFGLP